MLGKYGLVRNPGLVQTQMYTDGNDNLTIEHKKEIHIFHKSINLLISSILNNIIILIITIIIIIIIIIIVKLA